ncbi:MAG TPA: hypothetical protein PLF11_14475 [Bacillota bacterium]|jgi:hypothetical protein|nr:hypothetical protein [Bacillota bacterium]
MPMNLSIQKSTLTSRRAIGITAILSACVVILAFNACRPSPSERLVQDIDHQMQDAYGCYTSRPFGEVTNTLIRYIGFLERTEHRVETYRDVDLLLYIARVKLGYMLLCAGQVDSAYAELSLAYERHKRVQEKARMDAVPRSEFVAFVIAGVEKLDAKTGAAWKSEYSLKPDVVKAVNALFASNAIAVPLQGRN